jgi:competence protein ComEA
MNATRFLGTLVTLGALLGAANAHAQRATKRPAPGEAASSAAGVVNLNTATAEQLMLLPGIGTSKAQAILEARRHQPFASVDQIVRVRGIGRATLRRLRPYLAVHGDTTLAQAVRAPRAPSAAGSADPEPPRPHR